MDGKFEVERIVQARVNGGSNYDSLNLKSENPVPFGIFLISACSDGKLAILNSGFPNRAQVQIRILR